MKLTTKLTTLTLGLILPLSFVSCKDAEKKAADAVAEGKDKVEASAADVADKAKDAVAAVPKDPAAILGMFDNMNTTLEGVTDLDTAKTAMPALENAGTLVKKGMAAIGGDEKMEAAMAAAPELKAKFGTTMTTLMGHMQRIKGASPEAYEFIDKKMDAIMK